MMYLSIALLCMAFMPISCTENIHEYMNREELYRTFNTDFASVPNYEIVKIQLSNRLHKREHSSGSHLRMRAFGENINLWLHPRDSILVGDNTPVYYGQYSPHQPEGVQYIRKDGLMQKVGTILEDPETLTSLVIDKNKSDVNINGFIGSKKLAVRSLPKRVSDEYRRRRAINDFDDAAPYYAVFKTHGVLEHLPVIPVNETRFRRMISDSGFKIPDVLYPEILLVVESTVYKAQGDDIYGLLQYLLAFMNGVDMKYRSLESPRFRFHISGIIISKDPEVTPYISKHMITQNTFKIVPSIAAVGPYYWRVKETFPLDTYDIVATMTRLEFDQEGVLGVANKGTVCSRNDVQGYMDGVTIFRDDGRFDGIHTLAHEIGHVLGAGHDYGSSNCMNANGHIMAGGRHFTANSSDFSICAMDDIQKNLETNSLKCLYNLPANSGKDLPRLMAGRMVNLDEQCKAVDRVAYCRNESVTTSLCLNLYCINSSGNCLQTNTPALDGTECEDENMFCLHHRCVSLLE